MDHPPSGIYSRLLVELVYSRGGYGRGGRYMGRESKVVKERTCQSCEKVLVINSKQMVDHSRMCKRYQKLGLIMPGGVELK